MFSRLFLIAILGLLFCSQFLIALQSYMAAEITTIVQNNQASDHALFPSVTVCPLHSYDQDHMFDNHNLSDLYLRALEPASFLIGVRQRFSEG